MQNSALQASMGAVSWVSIYRAVVGESVVISRAAQLLGRDHRGRDPGEVSGAPLDSEAGHHGSGVPFVFIVDISSGFSKFGR